MKKKENKMKNKRWIAKIVYQVDDTVTKIVYHYVDELEELQDLVEKGPDFGAIKSFEISYTGLKTTIEESRGT